MNLSNRPHLPNVRRHRRSNICQRMNRVLLMMFALGLLAVAAAVFWPGIDKRRQLDDEYSEALEKLEERRKYRDQLVKKENLLRNDPAYIEMEARDRLDYHKPGETVIRIERNAEGAAIGLEVQ